jgi:Protein kinase domain
MSNDPPSLAKPSVASSGTDHDALPPGTRFGEFEIIRVLGVGGFGIVYLARDHSLEREVALKEYMPASLAARGAGPQITIRSSSFAETYAIGLRSFVNEARLLARFDHPSLVKVYRFWEDNATAYMVMPFLQGTTLRDTRRSMPHPPDEAWVRSVISPILSALELLHREGVYHRDIAPDNILLPREGPPVLLDFGAARRVISDRTQSLTAILKPSYAPIEQYAEMTQLRQGPWTDLYALGAVVHYLLFGTPPAPATARAVQDDADALEERVVPGVSPRFLEAMAWMLAVRPSQRPQSGEQLRAVLDGHAQIPPRGPAGTTIPGALTQAGATPATRAPATGAEPARGDTAFAPTYMPTARVTAPAPAQPPTFSPTAAMPTARPTATQSPAAPPSRPALPAAVVTRPEPRAASGPDPRVATSMPPPSRPAPLAGQPARTLPPGARPGARASRWLALAGVVVVMLAVAVWQFAVRRGADAEQANAGASAAASGGVASPAIVSVPTVPTVPTAPAAPPATTATPAAAQPAPPPVATGDSASGTAPPLLAQETKPAAAHALPASAAEVLARPAAAGDRSALADSSASAASGARARPPGRPVPKVGDETTTAVVGGAAASSVRASDVTAGAVADRSHAGSAVPSREQAQARSAVVSPVPVAPPQPATAREACGNRGFFAMAVCMDDRCEEARFRNQPECVPILERKHSREGVAPN